MAAVKRTLGDNSAHLEVARGTSEDNIAYCTKADSRVSEAVTFGTPAQSGVTVKDSASNAMRAVIEDPSITDEELRDKFPGTYLKLGSKRLREAKSEVLGSSLGNVRPVHVDVRWGDPGTGKTQSVFTDDVERGDLGRRIAVEKGLESFYTHNVFVKRGMGKWFDGYTGQPVLLLDDFAFSTVEDADMLLSVLDRYYCNVEVKGGTARGMWCHVVLTTNIPPDQWFMEYGNGFARCRIPMCRRAAIMNRITTITHFTGESHRDDHRAPPFRDYVPPATPSTVPRERSVSRASSVRSVVMDVPAFEDVPSVDLFNRFPTPTPSMLDTRSPTYPQETATPPMTPDLGTLVPRGDEELFFSD